MDMPDTLAPPGLGHNIGDLPTVEQIAFNLEASNAAALVRVEELIAKGEKYLVITSDEEDAAATQFMVSCRSRWKDSEAERVKEKSVWDDRASAVHNWFRTKILDPLALGPTKPNEPFDPVERGELGIGVRINRAQTIYKANCLRALDEQVAHDLKKKREAEAAAAKKAEEDRRAAAELELAAARARKPERVEELKAQAEAATVKAEQSTATANQASEERAGVQAALEAPAADKTRVRGSLGGVSSLKSFTDFRDIDRTLIDLETLRPFFTTKALEQAVGDYIKGNKASCEAHIKAGTQPVKGVTIFTGYKNQGRA